METLRNDYKNSLDQLMTISCILAGFAFSGLISLPGIDENMFEKIITFFDGNFVTSFYISFYFLFFSSICFLSSIMTILVYKANNFTVPMAKLKRIYLIANVTFAIAISSLMVSIISFGIPNTMGFAIALFLGLGVGGSFIWENLMPQQVKKRQEQVKREMEAEKDDSEEREVETKEKDD